MYLKYIQQIIAAASSHPPVNLIFSVSNQSLKADLETINQLIKGRTCTVKELFEMLETSEDMWPQFSHPKAFLQYLLHRLSPKSYGALKAMSKEEIMARHLVQEAAVDEAAG